MSGRMGLGVRVALVGMLVAAPLAAQERPDRERERVEAEARAMERARETMERAAERLREMEGRMERGEATRVLALRRMEGFPGLAFDMGRGARLGVSLTVGGAEGEVRGARVEAVSPGSPAERAGIQAGDLITSVGGTSVLAALPDREQEERAGREATAAVGRVMALVRALEPGDTVQVEVLRDGAPQSFDVVTDRAGISASTFSFPSGVRARVVDAPRVATLFAPGRVAGMSLVPVNPALGEYFGTSRGVLVTELPEESATGLRAGDVILRIGDREVEDVAHARRVLASYRSGEEVTFQVMRRQREETVRGRME